MARGLPFFIKTRATCASLLTVWGFCLGAIASRAHAAQTDIPGPSGSVAFGTSVTVLSNGNIVVADANASAGAAANVGAVYLYGPSGALISKLAGSSANDQVGSGGIVPVGTGNFVVLSPNWTRNGAASAGAATWVNGTTGLAGVVSVDNSLVGTTANDQVGLNGIAILANGNFVVSSPNWNGTAIAVGAATWVNGNTGLSGAVSAVNSLVGTTANDNIGIGGLGIVPLSNGNYVVTSYYWDNGTALNAGAVTWGDGNTGVSGAVSPANSLVGSATGDLIGYGWVTPLSNGNYVVASPLWSNGATAQVGAATWGSGTTGITGPVSTTNSLYGTTAGDNIGFNYPGAVALTNGNYVVVSYAWNNGVNDSNVGAVTWGNGVSGIVGPVSASNSLIGTTTHDHVGSGGARALSNGNYVVSSPYWSNGSVAAAGAATFGSGSTGVTGSVSINNSLVGTTTDDLVSIGGITGLANGNYVVASFVWHNGYSGNEVGAATWGDGTSGISGAISTNNSLVGTYDGDNVGEGVIALSNGNYVVRSYLWFITFGATTWGSGSSGIAGAVSPNNSLVGSSVNDKVGANVVALHNGNYVVASGTWNGGVPNSSIGSVTWCNGSTGLTGAASYATSLIGTTTNDQVGSYVVFPFPDGNYVVFSQYWNNGGLTNAGAMTLASGRFRLKGTIQPWNSVLGMVAGGGYTMTLDYDVNRHRLVVGKPLENIVSLFTMDQILAADFEP